MLDAARSMTKGQAGAVSYDAGGRLVSAFCSSGGSPDGTKCANGLTVGLRLKKLLTN
jgi:hypothetical protein